jgi:hypothetical protein
MNTITSTDLLLGDNIEFLNKMLRRINKGTEKIINTLGVNAKRDLTYALQDLAEIHDYAYITDSAKSFLTSEDLNDAIVAYKTAYAKMISEENERAAYAKARANEIRRYKR